MREFISVVSRIGSVGINFRTLTDEGLNTQEKVYMLLPEVSCGVVW